MTVLYQIKKESIFSHRNTQVKTLRGVTGSVTLLIIESITDLGGMSHVMSYAWIFIHTWTCRSEPTIRSPIHVSIYMMLSIFVPLTPG